MQFFLLKSGFDRQVNQGKGTKKTFFDVHFRLVNTLLYISMVLSSRRRNGWISKASSSCHDSWKPLKFSKICEGWFPIYEVRINASHKSQFTLLFLFKSYFCFRFFGLWVIAVIRESFRQNLLYRMVWPSLRFVTGHIGWNTWLK